MSASADERRPVATMPGVTITRDGRVYSPRGRLLKHQVNEVRNHGAPYVEIRYGKGSIVRTVSYLICEAWHHTGCTCRAQRGMRNGWRRKKAEAPTKPTPQGLRRAHRLYRERTNPAD